ncbi:MAG TPA: amidohydrolase family protein [Acidimicrobiales bacterium]
MVRRARIGSDETDLRIEGGRIVEIGRGLRRSASERELDVGGGQVIPGLHDHHLHLLALVAARRSVAVGPPQVRDPAGLAAALAEAAAARPPGTWIRAVGYHQSVAGDLDRAALDRLVPRHPLRVQHRSGVLWVCNSPALARLDAESAGTLPGVERDDAGRLTGRLWRMDTWLAGRLAGEAATESAPGHPAQDLAQLSAAAAAVGVTGWTEATADRSDRDTRLLARAVASGAVHQRLHLMLPRTVAADVVNEAWSAGATTGPVKIVLDDPALPPLDELAGVIGRAHSQRRPVAVHCVTRVQLLLTMAALDEAGTTAGDRIEHGAVIPTEVLPRLARAGLTVVTQPNFVAERGDQYLAEVAPADLPDLWRGQSLIAAGVAVAAGSDAPFGSSDPWLAMRGAVRRRTASGVPLGPAEAVTPATALRWWCGSATAPARPRRLEPGAPADLVVLDGPLADVLASDEPVRAVATVIAGEVVEKE